MSFTELEGKLLEALCKTTAFVAAEQEHFEECHTDPDGVWSSPEDFKEYQRVQEMVDKNRKIINSMIYRT